MTYQPGPREQFYLTLIAGVAYAVSVISWPAGAPAWVTYVSAIAGTIALALHELPSVAAQIPQSITVPIVTQPPPTPNHMPSTVINMNPTPTPTHKTWNSITQTFEEN